MRLDYQKAKLVSWMVFVTLLLMQSLSCTVVRFGQHTTDIPLAQLPQLLSQIVMYIGYKVIRSMMLQSSEEETHQLAM